MGENNIQVDNKDIGLIILFLNNNILLKYKETKI